MSSEGFYGRDEGGYALIATLWLLLLSASVAGMLMMRAVETSKASAVQRASLMKSATEESALQTAAADLLLNGTASRFGTLPSSAAYETNGRTISVSASFESERLDINETSLESIDVHLRAQGVIASTRAALLARLSASRAGGAQIESNAAVSGLIEEPCVAASFTAYGGRTSASPTLNGFGVGAQSQNAGAWRLRVEGMGGGRTIVARPGIAGQQPLLVLETMVTQAC